MATISTTFGVPEQVLRPLDDFKEQTSTLKKVIVFAAKLFAAILVLSISTAAAGAAWFALVGITAYVGVAVAPLAVLIISAGIYKIIKRKNPEQLEQIKTAELKTRVDFLNANAFGYKNIHIDQESLKIICNYLETNKNDLIAEAKKNNVSVFKRSSLELPRSILVTPEGSIFILFNKSKKTDMLLGKGGNKKVKFAVEYNTGKWWASASCVYDPKDGEQEKLALVKDIPGFISSKTHIIYQGKNKEKKARILTPFYKDGELTDSMNSMSLVEKKAASKQIILAITSLHKKGYLFCDLKPPNIFVSRHSTGIKASIGDVGSICSKTDKSFIVTSTYAPPEFAKASKLNDYFPYGPSPEVLSPAFLEAVTEKLDVWQLGCILYEMYIDPKLPWHGALNVIDELSILSPTWFTKPENTDSIQHLIWEMLRVDPEDRISSEALEKRLAIFN